MSLLAKYQEPVDLADLAPLPDFRLVPRDQEEQVCQWDKLRMYSPQVATLILAHLLDINFSPLTGLLTTCVLTNYLPRLTV